MKILTINKNFVGRLKQSTEPASANLQPSFSNLPKPKSKKGILSGRVGIGAERKRSSSVIKIPSSLPIKKQPTVIEETIDLTCPATYDIPLDENNATINQDISVQKRVTRSGMGDQGMDITTSTSEDESSDDIAITKIITAKESGVSPKKKRKLVLSDEEKSIIIVNEMLTDESINLF